MLFKTEVRKIVEAEMPKFAAAHNLRWSNAGAKEEFIQHVTRNCHVVNDGISPSMQGRALKDGNLHEYFMGEIKRLGLTTRDLSMDYVSPYRKRSKESAAQHYALVREVVSKQIESGRYQFGRDGAKDELIDIISQNFLVQTINGDPVFHKLHDDTFVSTKSWTLKDLMFDLGANRLIDREKTDLAQKDWDQTYLEKAKHISGGDKKPHVLLELRDKLKKIDAEISTPLAIDRKNIPSEADLAKHFYKVGLGQTFKMEHELTLHETNILHKHSGIQAGKICKLDDIAAKVAEIKHAPPVQELAF